MQNRAFIDRIEGSQAVLLIDGKEVVVPCSQLPKGAREGVWLTPDMKAIDLELTEQIKRETAARRARLMADDDGGDISL
ncbi:MAG: DUF3006 domain-containing protein [Myxococcales bacterium]|jgi:hypothetical protein|nr:DUF3006 domain-containing protein [Myxococcales bacterium]